MTCVSLFLSVLTDQHMSRCSLSLPLYSVVSLCLLFYYPSVYYCLCFSCILTHSFHTHQHIHLSVFMPRCSPFRVVLFPFAFLFIISSSPSSLVVSVACLSWSSLVLRGRIHFQVSFPLFWRAISLHCHVPTANPQSERQH